MSFAIDLSSQPLDDVRSNQNRRNPKRGGKKSNQCVLPLPTDIWRGNAGLPHNGRVPSTRINGWRGVTDDIERIANLKSNCPRPHFLSKYEYKF